MNKQPYSITFAWLNITIAFIYTIKLFSDNSSTWTITGISTTFYTLPLLYSNNYLSSRVNSLRLNFALKLSLIVFLLIAFCYSVYSGFILLLMHLPIADYSSIFFPAIIFFLLLSGAIIGVLQQWLSYLR